MDIEIKKEIAKIRTRTKCKSFTVGAETDLIVPEARPDIGRVLQVDAFPKINGNEVQTDRILVYGKVDFRVMYMPEKTDEGIKTLYASASFTDVSDMQGMTPGMNLSVESQTERVNFKVINGRKLSLKSDILVSAAADDEKERELISDINNKNIEVLKEKNEYISFDKTQISGFEIEDIVPIPSSQPLAEDIIKADFSISDYTDKVINNKVIIKGRGKLCAVYKDSENSELNVLEGEIPFTEVIDFEGIDEKMRSMVSLTPKGLKYEIKGDERGNINALNITADIETKIRAIDTSDIEYIKDCYATKYECNTDCEEISLSSLKGTFSKQTALKDIVSPGDKNAKIERIYDVICDVYANRVKIGDSEVELDGSADVYVLYMTGDKDRPLASMKKEIPFKESISVPSAYEGCVCDIDLTAFGISYSLSGENGAEVRLNIKTDGAVYEKQSVFAISNISIDETAPEKKMPSVTVYFAGADDSIWDIAKKYKTSESLIRSVNHLESGEIKKGDKLIIPKFKTTVI